MCLALLAEDYFAIDFMGEYIRLLQGEQHLEAREVYDVFFQAPHDWQDARMVCLSPHNLLGASGLTVKARDAAGAGGKDDQVYKGGHGYGCKWDHESRQFVVDVFCGKETASQAPETFQGELLLPKIHVPGSLESNELCQEIMSRKGTVFELVLGDLTGGESYAFRLEVTPANLLGFRPKRKQQSVSLEYMGFPVVRWSQVLSVYSPRTCYREYCHTLAGMRNQPDYAEPAGAIQAVVGDNSKRLLPLARHRIMVICPDGAEIERHETTGCVWKGDVFLFPADGHQMVAEWISGAKTYWSDEPEFLARTIWAHLVEWARFEAQTKEEVTASLNASHPNCSLIVDAMRNLRILVESGRKIAPAEPVTEARLEEAFAHIGADPDIQAKFRFMGYEIGYSLVYEHLGPDEQKALESIKFRHTWAFRLAIIGVAATVVLGLLGLLLTLYTICVN